MADMVPKYASTILEPTPGQGNLVKALEFTGRVTAPDDFFLLDPELRFDCVVINPPFSATSAFGEIPEDLNGMRLGYYILNECMNKSDHVIALMPWFTITDSDVRLRDMKKFGLRSITALPRKTFGYSRIQTCIFELHKEWDRNTIFHMFEFKDSGN